MFQDVNRGFTIHLCVVPKCVRKNHSDSLTVRPIHQPSNPPTALVNAEGNLCFQKGVEKVSGVMNYVCWKNQTMQMDGDFS